MDIHGACEQHKFAIAIGTLGGLSCPYLAEILEALAMHGFRDKAPDPSDRVDVDAAFTGRGLRGQETVSRFVWDIVQLPVAQFELNARVRIPIRRGDATAMRPFEGESRRILRCIAALSDAALLVAKRISN